MPIKLTLERVITEVGKSPADIKWGWRFRQTPYTRESWETFDIPVVCGVAGVYTAYLPDELDAEIYIRWYKHLLKEKALQELHEARQDIQQKIDSLWNAK